jgi:hypothetical protein
VEQYLHFPYVFMARYFIKHRDNFTFAFTSLHLYVSPLSRLRDTSGIAVTECVCNDAATTVGIMLGPIRV